MLRIEWWKEHYTITFEVVAVLKSKGYGLNVCVPPQPPVPPNSKVEILKPEVVLGGAFGRP